MKKELKMSQNDTENRPTHERRTYTVDEIAEILDIGRTSAYKLVKQNLFKSVRIGTTIRISKKSFEEWMSSKGM